MCPNFRGMYKVVGVNFIFFKIRTFHKVVAKMVPSLECFFSILICKGFAMSEGYVTEVANQNLLLLDF